MKFLNFFICKSKENEEEEEEEPPDKSKFKKELEKRNKHYNNHIVQNIPTNIVLPNKIKRENNINNSKIDLSLKIEKKYYNLEFKCQGYFSKVYKAQVNTGETVAIKRINKKFEHNFFQEYNFLRQIEHPNIIKILDCFVLERYYYMVLPYYEKDLFEIIPEIVFKPKIILRILKKITEGIVYLHNRDLIHGDIKPENIMIDKYLNPIIIDLGLTKHKNLISNEKKNRLSGTITYLPPEVLISQKYTQKMDIWSLGIIMYILMFNREPFGNSDNKRETFNNIKYREQYYPIYWRTEEGNQIYNDCFYKYLLDLNKKMLRKNMYERLNINNVNEYLEFIIIEQKKYCTKKIENFTHELIIRNIKRWRSY